MKHCYGIVFSDRNIDGNEKSFPPFQVRGRRNKMIVTTKFRNLLYVILKRFREFSRETGISVVKIQNIIVNHESRPVKSNSDFLKIIFCQEIKIISFTMIMYLFIWTKEDMLFLLFLYFFIPQESFNLEIS